MPVMDKVVIARAAWVLDNWEQFAWTTQGFGMIRTYLDDQKEYRLNVWDDRLSVPRVSVIHDHPWDFTSMVLCGRITNTRYERNVAKPANFSFQNIVTGEGGGPTGVVEDCHLEACPSELISPGGTYRQDREEIHHTGALRGTVTLNRRSPPTVNHTARVFWPLGEQWVDAMPRHATPDEVMEAVIAARLEAKMLRLEIT